MKVYVDLIIFLNFFFDFILLLSTSLVLKRRVSLKRIVIGSIVGSITIFSLFIAFTSLELFLLKIVLSIIIIVVTFGYKDFKYFINNIVYFYMISIILGGFIYYLNVSFSYKNVGMMFYHKGISINYVIVLLVTPCICYLYYKYINNIKSINSLYYKVDIYINNSIVKLIAYLDTGNTLVDPYSRKLVIITNSKEFKNIVKNNMFYYIPYKSVNEEGVIKCFRVNMVYIENIGIKKNVVVGVVDEKLKNGKVEVLLNNLLMEG